MPVITRKCFVITKTILFYLLFVAMGSIVAIPGPTLTVLQENMNENADINYTFTFRSLGSIVGAITGGLLLSHISKKDLVLTFESTAMAFFALGLPFCDYVWKFNVVIFFLGMTNQSLNTGVNVCCLKLWGRQAPSYFQALHFSFAVGGLLGPMIARPFLSNISANQYPPRVAYAYFIIACNSLIITLCFFLFSTFTTKQATRSKTHSFTSDSAVKVSAPQTKPRMTYFSLSLISVAMFFGVSFEITYSQCVSTFAEKGIFNMSKMQGSDLATTFWGSYMSSRLLAIFVSNRVENSTIILANLITLVAAGVILVALGFKFASAVWIGSALVGLGSGPLFPATITWVSEYIEITFMIGAMFFVIASTAEMSIPYFVLAHVNQRPKDLNYYILSAAIVGSIFYLLVWFIFSRIEDRYHESGGKPETIATTKNAPEGEADSVSLNERFKHSEHHHIEHAHLKETSAE